MNSYLNICKNYSFFVLATGGSLFFNDYCPPGGEKVAIIQDCQKDFENN